MKDCAFFVTAQRTFENIIRGVEKFFGRFAYASNQIRPERNFPSFRFLYELFRIFSLAVYFVVLRSQSHYSVAVAVFSGCH